jgi:hypothetical protein
MARCQNLLWRSSLFPWAIKKASVNSKTDSLGSPERPYATQTSAQLVGQQTRVKKGASSMQLASRFCYATTTATYAGKSFHSWLINRKAAPKRRAADLCKRKVPAQEWCTATANLTMCKWCLIKRFVAPLSTLCARTCSQREGRRLHFVFIEVSSRTQPCRCQSWPVRRYGRGRCATCHLYLLRPLVARTIVTDDLSESTR